MSNINKIEKIASYANMICNIIVATVIFLIIGHYVIGIADYVKTSQGDPRKDSIIYKDNPDIKEYWNEQQKVNELHFEPYFLWKKVEYHGKHINVDASGVRATVKNPNVKGEKKVFVFGGSTLWGEGSPDDSTIPSFLQSRLGDGYDVYNYGEDGFVSTQELNYLLLQLSLGNVPDVVIFYDGVNDGYAGAYSPAIPRDPPNIRMDYLNKRRNRFVQLIAQSNYDKLIKFILRKSRGSNNESAEWDNKIKPHITLNARNVVKMYEAHIKQVQALAKEYKFKAFFFWQPNLFSLTKKLSANEEDIIREASPVMIESQQQVYLESKDTFSKREKEKIFVIGNVFDDVERPIYLDWCHVGPGGNRLIADKMMLLIGEEIRNLSDS